MSDKEQGLLPLAAEQAAILAKCRNAFCHAVIEKFNCMAILHNIKESEALSNTSGVFCAEKRYFTRLSSGVEISVWKDDLTQHKVEAVVNAANEKLQHGGGLAQALSMAGGPQIQRWSDDIIKRYGYVKTGEAVLTPAGNLPFKYIIHAVGPKVPQNPTQKEIGDATPLLYNAITSILQTVLRENITSVAIPALSSGLFNFPRDRCADIIVKAIKTFHDHGGFQGRNLEIHLVNNDEPSVQEMERATRAIFDPPSTSRLYSGAVKDSSQSMTSSTSQSLQFENIILYLKRGAIEDEMVDVLVNTIAPDCKLHQGVISRAILKKAGDEIQNEIYKKKSNTSFYSSKVLYKTKGYNLYCKSVFHTVCAHRSDSKSNEILFNVVLESLKKAAEDYESISFPAIGTGNLDFKKWEVAKIMMDAVAEFAKQNKRKKLDVYFVVFPKDNDMMKAFENEMKKRKGQATSPEVQHRQNYNVATKETTTNEMPSVMFQSATKCNESLREAKGWACNMLQLSGKSTINNNHVIYLGQKEHEFLLTLQAVFDVRIEEFFRSGNGGITITGSPSGVSCAAIEVESMLCKTQNDFARAEERDILYSVVRWSCKEEPWIQTPEISGILEKAFLAGEENHVFKNHKVSLKYELIVDNTGKTSSVKRKCLLDPFQSLNNSFYARNPVTKNYFLEIEGRKASTAFRLSIIKVEKLENIVLKQLFDKNRQRIKCQPKRLYQCVSAQYVDLICRVGFQKEFAPPAEQRHGNGIYFSTSVEGALKLWRNLEHEQYVYIIQAQVLTGNSAIGSPDFILPPSLKGDPLERYDSLSDMGETYVIFSVQQALPEYLVICAKSSSV